MIERWKQVYWPKDDECSLVKRGAESADTFVTVSDMQGSFYILFIGERSYKGKVHLSVSYTYVYSRLSI